MPAINWTLKFANSASARLAANITAGDTTFSLATGQGGRFPALGTNEYFVLSLDDPESGNSEIINVVARSGDSLTVERAQEGTTALAFPAATTVVAARITKGVLEKFLQRTS